MKLTKRQALKLAVQMNAGTTMMTYGQQATDAADQFRAYTETRFERWRTKRSERISTEKASRLADQIQRRHQDEEVFKSPTLTGTPTKSHRKWASAGPKESEARAEKIIQDYRALGVSTPEAVERIKRTSPQGYGQRNEDFTAQLAEDYGPDAMKAPVDPWPDDSHI